MDKNVASVSLSIILAVILISSATSDLAKDREKCADQLVGLATCLPYVSGDAKTPTIDCCTGLEQVLKNSKECLCVLVRDRNDPNLGLKIDATLALGLPDKCHAPADVSKCPALLHLAPNSTDAKVFEDFVKGAKANNTTSSDVVADPGNGKNSSSIANEKSDGRRANWFGSEINDDSTLLVLIILYFNLYCIFFFA